MPPKKSNLEEIMSIDLSYNYHQKEKFHKEAKRVLRILAKLLPLDKSTYTVSSCKGGMAVGGEVTLKTPLFELCIYQHPFQLEGVILFRCDKTDQNKYLHVYRLNEIDEFAAFLVNEFYR